jgi:hypothetical protein
VRVEFRPAPVDTGIVFVRSRSFPRGPDTGLLGLPHRNPSPHDARQRRRDRGNGRARDGGGSPDCGSITAKCGSTAPKCPACDGSSRDFVTALDAAAAVEQSSPRPTLVVADVTRVGCDDSWVEAPPPQGGFSIRYRLDYGASGPIGRQTLQMPITPDSFRRDLASARTFVTKDEADWLLRRGLGSGVTTSDLLVFGDDGPIDNELRFQDECVRHKTLDLVATGALRPRYPGPHRRLPLRPSPERRTGPSPAGRGPAAGGSASNRVSGLCS